MRRLFSRVRLDLVIQRTFTARPNPSQHDIAGWMSVRLDGWESSSTIQMREVVSSLRMAWLTWRVTMLVEASRSPIWPSLRRRSACSTYVALLTMNVGRDAHLEETCMNPQLSFAREGCRGGVPLSSCSSLFPSPDWGRL